MASEFITRIERGNVEPYTVIFKTDDFDKYKHIEDECRKVLNHSKPTVDAVPVVRCGDCTFHNEINCPQYYRRNELPDDWYCRDGERRSDREKY